MPADKIEEPEAPQSLKDLIAEALGEDVAKSVTEFPAPEKPDYHRDRVQELIEARGRSAASFACEGYGDLIDPVKNRLSGFLEGPFMAPYPNLLGMTYRLEDLVMALRVFCARDGAGTYMKDDEIKAKDTIVEIMAWSVLVYGEMQRRRQVDRADIITDLVRDKAALECDLEIAQSAANRNGESMARFLGKLTELAQLYEKETGKKWTWGPEGRHAPEIIGSTPVEKRGPVLDEIPLQQPKTKPKEA